MSKTKKLVLFWGLFLLVFITLLVLATLYDYQISELLTGNGLHDGNYYSSNVFGIIFEIIGEMPLYIFVSFATVILINKSLQINKKGLKIMFVIILFVFGTISNLYGWYKLGGYLAKIYPESSFCSILHDNMIVYGVYFLMSACLEFVLFYLFKTKLSKYNDKLVPLAFIILLCAAISQGIVQAIKPLFGRERFRAIYYFTNIGVDHPGFSKWYVMNGNSSKIVQPYLVYDGVTKDFFKSFPSGHTTAAGIVYSLIFVPFLYEKFSSKKSLLIFTIVPIFITGLVATARIVMGAHYLSDVLIGGTVAFLSAIAAYYLTKLLNKKLNFM